MWSCQSAADQMKYAVKMTRLALSSMLGVLNQETFTVRSVRDLMWGYNDSLFKLAKDVMPPENVVPHDLFGLFVGVCVLSSSLHSFPHPNERLMTKGTLLFISTEKWVDCRWYVHHFYRGRLYGQLRRH